MNNEWRPSHVIKSQAYNLISLDNPFYSVPIVLELKSSVKNFILLDTIERYFRGLEV